MYTITFHQMIVVLVMVLFTGMNVNSQIMKPERPIEDFIFQENTDLVYSVDPKTNGITEVFLKDTDVEHQLYKLKEDCYRCEFYLGSVEGTFKIHNKRIVNSKSSVFIIKTTRNLMPGTDFSPGAQYAPGTEFSLAGIKTTVLANKNGSFILKAD